MKYPGRRMGAEGFMRLEAEAKNSSLKERMWEVRGAEIRSGVDVRGDWVCRGEGAGPM